MNRSNNDQNFLNSCLGLLAGLKFPTFKSTIIDYVKKSTNDSDVISLFESLDGYIQFRDQYHVQKALEVNDPDKKTENQITDQTREDPSLKTLVQQLAKVPKILKRSANQKTGEIFQK